MSSDGKPVVVLGAGGLLGSALVRELEARKILVRGLDRKACPIEDERRVAQAVADAAWVANCAAYTNVDGAEMETRQAWAANALGAENVARATAARGVVVVHVSTDFVFDGDGGRPYDEFDPPRPLSSYARSKRAGELLVQRATPRHHVVRVQGLYGAGGRNFSSRLQALLKGGTPGLRLDDERLVQPTWATAAARALSDVAASSRYGLWHASCAGATTWHRFALRMAERLGITPNWQAVPSHTLTLPAPRPRYCLLDNRRLALYGLPGLPTWEDALDQYLADSTT